MHRHFKHLAISNHNVMLPWLQCFDKLWFAGLPREQWRAVQEAFRRILRGNSHAGCCAHILGLRHPYDLWISAGFHEGVEHRRLPQCQRKGGAEGKRCDVGESKKTDLIEEGSLFMIQFPGVTWETFLKRMSDMTVLFPAVFTVNDCSVKVRIVAKYLLIY